MSCVWWRGVGVGWGYYCADLGRQNSTHAPTSPSLLNTHEISYPPPPYTRRMPKYSCLQVCCQSINLKMAIKAETCSWYLCNKQHMSNHQIVVFDSWLIQLQYIKTQRGRRTIWSRNMLPAIFPVLYSVRDADFEKCFGKWTHNGDVSALNYVVVDYIKCGIHFEWLKNYWLLKDSAPWS